MEDPVSIAAAVSNVLGKRAKDGSSWFQSFYDDTDWVVLLHRT